MRWHCVWHETMVSPTGKLTDRFLFCVTCCSPWERPCFTPHILFHLTFLPSYRLQMSARACGRVGPRATVPGLQKTWKNRERGRDLGAAKRYRDREVWPPAPPPTFTRPWMSKYSHMVICVRQFNYMVKFTQNTPRKPLQKMQRLYEKTPGIFASTYVAIAEKWIINEKVVMLVQQRKKSKQKNGTHKRWVKF